MRKVKILMAAVSLLLLTVSSAIAAEAPAGGCEKAFEYKFMQGMFSTEIKKVLNDMGREGWEIINVNSDSKGFMNFIALKRAYCK